MDKLMEVINAINGVIWHDYVLFAVLGTGVLFTLWSGFSQFRALTHGTAVVRGKYDDKADPGAINHFQALSTALSATVGLGNIAGVAIAISLGGPGAVFWMWVTGIVGMSLKLTEVTQAMMFRNTDDPDNPHGGAMWVCKKGFAKISPALAPLGVVVGGLFCVTLLVSCVTGGNMFQAWNVADISFSYFGMPKFVAGIVMTVIVGLVIIGGIKRIGDVAGKIVPVMCLVYILAGLAVIVMEIDRIPEMFRLILTDAFSPSEGAGAFIGGAAGYGFLKGMQRALFSSEAGQGSAPIAHSAAKTDEPVREGVVAGLEPFIDTIVVCTITAVVILLSGAWNRDPSLKYDPAAPPTVTQVVDAQGVPVRDAGGNYLWQVSAVQVMVTDENEAKDQLREGTDVFLVLEGEENGETGGQRHRLNGELGGTREDGFTVRWNDARSESEKGSGVPEHQFKTAENVAPTVPIEGVFFDFKGATLTAKAFDRVMPGLGYWIVPATVWLFAISTMISWSYYGEQAIVYLFGARLVMAYRIVYCLLILITAQIIRTQDELDVLSTLGTGVMLWANIPIMLIFGPMAMRAYHEYMGRLKRGEMQAHAAPKFTDVVEGKDVE